MIASHAPLRVGGGQKGSTLALRDDTFAVSTVLVSVSYALALLCFRLVACRQRCASHDHFCKYRDKRCIDSCQVFADKQQLCHVHQFANHCHHRFLANGRVGTKRVQLPKRCHRQATVFVEG